MSTDYKPQGIEEFILHVRTLRTGINRMYSLLARNSEVTLEVVEELTKRMTQIAYSFGNVGESLLEIMVSSVPLPKPMQEELQSRLKSYPTRHLTPKELEVLGLAAKGYLNGQIAGQMGLATITVQKHVASAYSKLREIGAYNRVLAAIWYKEHYDPEYKLGPKTYPTEPLTERQLEVVREVAGGGSHKTIAAKLSRSTITVKKRFQVACKKMGIYEGDRQVLAGLWYYQHHGLPPYKPS